MAASNQALKTLLANGNVGKALEQLVRLTEHTDDRDLLQRVLTLSGQFTALKNQHLTGLLEGKDYRLQLNRITAAVADIIETPVNGSINWKKWAVVLGVLAAIAGITGYTLRDLWRKPEVTPVEKPAVITQPDTLVLVNPPARPAPQKPSTGKNNVQITVKDKAKVGTIITGDSNKIDIKQDF